MGFPEIYQLFAPGKCQILPSFPLSLRALQKWGHIFWHRKKGEIEKYFLLFTPPASVKPDVGHVSFFPKQESDKIYRRPQRQKSETFEKQKVFFLERLGKTEEIGNRIGVLFPPPPNVSPTSRVSEMSKFGLDWTRNSPFGNGEKRFPIQSHPFLLPS